MKVLSPVKTVVVTAWLYGSWTAGAAQAGWVAEFYAAADPEQRQAIVRAVDVSAHSFEDLYGWLSNPPPREGDAAVGLIRDFTQDGRGERFPYGLFVPAAYDAGRPHPLVILLHGTVSREKPKRTRARRSVNDEILLPGVIQAFPASWSEAKWWTPAQSANLERMISKIKADYHVDTDKIFLVGISDGATGGFYMSATNPSPYAGFVSVIGFPGVLKGSRVRLKENVYPINMRALRILAFNTEKDALYPVDKMQFYIDAFRDIGIDIEMVADPLGGHDVNALKRAVPGIRAFVDSTRRTAYPDSITWQYESGSSLHRVHWLIVNDLLPREERDRSLDELPGMQPTSAYTGLIELLKQGNTVMIQNLGVRSYSLLMSTAHFDFDRPIRVIENDVLIFEGAIRPSKRVLLKYAALDFDPARLYGAELTIEN